MVADMFGFYGEETGHSSGGQSLHDYCQRQHLNPRSLYIGWVENCRCVRCVHNELYDYLNPGLNKARPARCDVH